jgi:hypothetical protein
MKSESVVSIWLIRRTERMCAVSTKKLSKARTNHGTLRQPSVQAVVLRSTATDMLSCGDLPINENTVKVLAAFVAALLSNTMSGDVIQLSLCSAEKMAKESGVPEKECKRVLASLMLFWRRKMSQNPLSSMF